MQLLFFLLVYPILWLVSILPFRLLYMLSDAVCFLLYRVVRYRRNVVRQNLLMAFPEMTLAERIAIEKKSYRHLCDLFLEVAKTMTISRNEINRRFAFPNFDVYLDMEKEGKSIAVMCAHYASYEWVISMNSRISFTGFAIYKKIANPYFDKLVRNIRSRFRATLITTKETIPTIQHNIESGILGVYGFASDQSPKISKAFHWTTFMGIHSPVYTGAEMLAKRFDMNVIFLKVRKVKRGHYEATFEKLAENPRSVPDYEITDEFMRRVEDQIREAPEFYLWTHKRWKSPEKKVKG
jgi:KDO2-lipid IV(A) lauroyltransferase